MPVFRIGHFPSESDSETMLKVLKWGVVPLNLKGHGMTPHSLCWARINSPQFIRRFNSKLKLKHSLGAYYNKKKCAKSPRDHFIDPQTQATFFVWENGHFQHLQMHISGSL